MTPEIDTQLRLTATDKAGKEHAAAHEDNWHQGLLSHLTVAFSDLPADQVKSLRLEARPYHWAAFRNVALQPDPKKTAPAAEVLDHK